MRFFKILFFFSRIRFFFEVKEGKYIMCNEIGNMDFDKFSLIVFKIVYFGIILFFLYIKIYN